MSNDIRIVDNFASYGTGATGRTNMLRNPNYAEMNSTTTPQTSNPRSSLGTHSLHFTDFAGSDDAWRVLFGTNETDFYIAGGIYLNQLPGGNTTAYLAQIRDSGNGDQCTLWITSTGALQLRNGNTGTVLGTSDAGVITVGSYQFFEARFTISNASGACEVRLDNDIVLNVTGVDTQGTSNSGADQMDICKVASPDGCEIDLTDFQFRGTTEVDDFLGDIVWAKRLLNADTAQTDFVRNTGSNDFEAIDDTTPDDDTTYIESQAVGDISEFGMEDTPANVSEIVAVVLRTLMKKTDAGVGTAQVSIISAQGSPETTAAGQDAAVPSTYTYRDDIFEVDPATGIAWLSDGFDAARYKIEQT